MAADHIPQSQEQKEMTLHKQTYSIKARLLQINPLLLGASLERTNHDPAVTTFSYVYEFDRY